MDFQYERIVSDVVSDLVKAWNAADGPAFGRHFAEDADFVNIRGEHFQTREAIAKGHQGIFDTIYKGSVRRGYVPDGLGITYRNEFIREGAVVGVDDDLVLHFRKKLSIPISTGMSDQPL